MAPMFADMWRERVRWHTITDPRVQDLPEGGHFRVMVGKLPVRVLRLHGRLHALLDQCPHQGRSFEGGWCDEGYLVCPWHRFHFDPATGHNRTASTANVPVYRVEEGPAGVRIGMPRNTFRLFGIDLW